MQIQSYLRLWSVTIAELLNRLYETNSFFLCQPEVTRLSNPRLLHQVKFPSQPNVSILTTSVWNGYNLRDAQCIKSRSANCPVDYFSFIMKLSILKWQRNYGSLILYDFGVAIRIPLLGTVGVSLEGAFFSEKNLWNGVTTILAL